jgi:sec-independent protein translocase protein TatB
MFGIDSGELLVIAVVALVVIGPKDLPRVMRVIGKWVGQARGMARHFRAGFDTMIREAELEDMEKQWRADNERIMREHPMLPGTDSDWGKTPPPATKEAVKPVESKSAVVGPVAAPAPASSKPASSPPPPARPAPRRSAPPVPPRRATGGDG